MVVIFRVDASISIGTGHVMRSLTLAEELKDRGVDVEFICRKHEGDMIDFIRERTGYLVHSLPRLENTRQRVLNQSNYYSWLGCDWQTDACQVIDHLNDKTSPIDWIIVDHYAIDHRWEDLIRPFTNKIMVIDDLADRKHNCDLLLDQNYYREKDRYKDLVPETCELMIGPNYTLLRKQFIEARKAMRQRTGEIKQILACFGGSDPTNETEKFLQSFKAADLPGVLVDVVIGQSNPYLKKIERLISSMPAVQGHFQVENMAELMMKADIAFGAGGTIHWERCCLGLPSIVVSLAENQVLATESLSEKKIVLYLGPSQMIQKYDIASIIKEISTNGQYQQMVEEGMKLVDGKGTARLVNHLII